MKPTSAPPIAETTRSAEACVRENSPVTSARTAIWKEMIPEASLRRPSPVRILMTRLGKLNLSDRAATAIASVGAKEAPKAKQAAKGTDK